MHVLQVCNNNLYRMATATACLGQAVANSSTNLAALAGVLVPTELPLVELGGDRDKASPPDPYPDTTK